MYEIILLGVVVWFALALAVALHAGGRDVNAGFWFGIVFVFGIFGVVFYLLAINQQTDSTRSTRPDRQNPVTGAEQSAIAATRDYMESRGYVSSEQIIDHIFPEYPAGYDSRQAWWDHFMAPLLHDRPEFTPVDADGTVWSIDE